MRNEITVPISSVLSEHTVSPNATFSPGDGAERSVFQNTSMLRREIANTPEGWSRPEGFPPSATTLVEHRRVVPELRGHRVPGRHVGPALRLG